MSYLVTKFKNIPKRWICQHCKRINDKEDQKCCFCGEEKPEKAKGQPRIKSSRTDYNGRWYQSKLEANYAKELDFRVKAGEVLEWKPQHKIELKVNGIKICNYFIDFLVTMKDGSRVYTEVKGMEQEVWKLKWKLCMALKDEIDKGAEWIVVK